MDCLKQYKQLLYSCNYDVNLKIFLYIQLSEWIGHAIVPLALITVFLLVLQRHR